MHNILWICMFWWLRHKSMFHCFAYRSGSPIDPAALWITFGNPWIDTAAVLSMRLIIIQQPSQVQYIPRNMHTVFALLCFVVVIHWLIFPYPSGLLHRHCGNLTVATVPAKQPWWIWINTSSEFIMNDCITTTKQSTTKPCAYFLGYTVIRRMYALRWDTIMHPIWSFMLHYTIIAKKGPQNKRILISQRTRDAITTSLLRQNDVAMSFWRNNDVIIALCVRWNRGIVGFNM